MELKQCPHCGKELPDELSFCPYCMHRLTAVKTVEIPKSRSMVPFWITVAALVVIAAILLGTLLLPDRGQSNTPLTPTDTFTNTPTASDKTPSSTSKAPWWQFWAEESGESSVHVAPESTHSVPSAPSYSSTVLPSIESSVDSAPASSESQTTSSQAQLPISIQRVYDGSKKMVPVKVEAWNQAAKNSGYTDYVITAVEHSPKVSTIFSSTEDGFALMFSKITLKNGITLHVDWEESADQTPGTNTFCAVSSSIIIPKAMQSLEEYGRVKYLLLATFTGHENPDFVDTFYSDEGWGDVGHMNSGVHNGYSYQKSGMYNGFFLEDTAYTVYFEDEPINQDFIEANGTNISYNSGFQFRKHNTSWWQEQHEGYIDYS